MVCLESHPANMEWEKMASKVSSSITTESKCRPCEETHVHIFDCWIRRSLIMARATQLLLPWKQTSQQGEPSGLHILHKEILPFHL